MLDKNMNGSLSYYDVGGYNSRQVPFRRTNTNYLKRYVSIDPQFEADAQHKRFSWYKCVVSDEEGEKDFYISNWRNGSLYEYTHLHQSYHKPREIIKVQCRKLSNIIKNHENEIDILKIDAHGSELPILKDVEGYMKDITAIQVEMWYAEWHKQTPLLDEVHDFLVKMSFYPSTIVAYYPGYAIEPLYINMNAPDEDKLKLVKSLWGATDKTAREAKILIEALEPTLLN